MQYMQIIRSKVNQNVIYPMQTFFQNLTGQKICDSKSDAL